MMAVGNGIRGSPHDILRKRHYRFTEIRVIAMLPIVLAFTTSIGYGTGDFLAARVARRLSPALMVFYIQSLQSIIVLLLAWLTSQPLTLSALQWGMAAGSLNAMGLMLYYQALTVGRAGVIAPIVASGAVVPMLVSIIRGTMPSLGAIAGLFLVIGGIVISALASDIPSENRSSTDSVKKPSQKNRYLNQCLPLALLAALSFGLFFILVNQGSTVAGEGWLWVALGVQLGALPLTLVSLLWRGVNRFVITETTTLALLGVITILNFSADASLTYAFSFGNLGIVSVLSSLGPVITGLLARLLTSESLSRLEAIGAGLIMLGILTVVYHH